MKRIGDQTIVITGASSGIGLATAKMAAQRGARVVLTSRNEEALREIEAELRRHGGQVTSIAADVRDEAQMRAVADTAVRIFGGIDTWVNDAGISIYGRTLDVPLTDQRQLFDTNFWGCIHGARAALPHLRRSGGTLINVGSETSERAIPLQVAYSASKHALKAWMDGLRMELEHDGVPVSVVLVEPASIDTPFPQHARNYMDREPDLPAPRYAPEVVAKAILHAAEKPQRTVRVGSGPLAASLMDQVAPRVADRMMEKALFTGQQTDEPRPRLDALDAPPAHEGETRGAGHYRDREHSAATWASLHPGGTVALLAAAALGAVAAWQTWRPASPGTWTARRPRERPTVH